MGVILTDYLLRNKFHRQRFYNHSQKELNHESIDFWLAIQKYKQKPSKTKMLAIMNDFVGSKAAHEVNLSFRNRRKLEQVKEQYEKMRTEAQGMWWWNRIATSDERKADPNVFNDAEEEIVSLLKDVTTRFTNTTAGQEAAKDFQILGNTYNLKTFPKELLNVFSGLEEAGLM